MVQQSYVIVAITFILMFLLMFSDYKRNIWPICFLITLFTFLYGSIAVSLLFGKELPWNFMPATHLHIALSIEISIVIFGLVSYFTTKRQARLYNAYKTRNFDEVTNIKIERASTILFWITIPFVLAINLERAMFVAVNSYTAYYQSFSSFLPTIFFNIASLNDVALFVLLATLPNKKKIVRILIIYVAISVFSLSYGQRNGFVLSLLVSFGYLIWRERISPDGERWITRRMIYIVCISAPCLMAFMFAFNEIRDGLSVSVDGFANQIVAFFEQQGTSVNVIGYGYEQIGRFNSNVNYVLSQIIAPFTENRIFASIFNTKIYSGQTVEAALYGHNYGSTITYIVMPHNYIAGIGLGTSYIAEAYHEYGYIGVIIVNIIYALICSTIGRILFNNPYLGGILLLMIKNILYSPRAAAFSFFTDTFTITVLIGVVTIKLIYNIQCNKTFTKKTKA